MGEPSTDLPNKVTVSWVVTSEVTVEISVTVVVVKVVVGRGGRGSGGYLRLGRSPWNKLSLCRMLLLVFSAGWPGERALVWVMVEVWVTTL